MKIKNITILFLCICLFGFNEMVTAQAVKVIVDKTQIKIGEQIKITIAANDIKTNETEILQWFNDFNDTSNHFEIISKTNANKTYS